MLIYAKITENCHFFIWVIQNSTLISVLVLSVQTGAPFYCSSDLNKETVFWGKDEVVSITRGYALSKAPVFWHDAALSIIYLHGCVW